MKARLPAMLGIILALAAADAASAQNPIDLLEPLPGSNKSTISVDPNDSIPALSILNTYIRETVPWVIGTSAGLAVLMVIIGGFQIMLSGGNDIAHSAGTKRIMSALLGLLLLIFAGIILHWLNANYYKMGP